MNEAPVEKARELAFGWATFTAAKMLIMGAFAWFLISDNIYSTGFEAFMPLFWPVALLYMATGTIGFLADYGFFFLARPRGRGAKC